MLIFRTNTFDAIILNMVIIVILYVSITREYKTQLKKIKQIPGKKKLIFMNKTQVILEQRKCPKFAKIFI